MEITNKTEELFVQKTYNKIACHFNDTRSYQWSWITEFMKQYNETHLIYDIGCGSGRNITPYFNNFPKCIGVDNCIKFIDICKNKGLEVFESDMTSLPFDNNSADAIISIASFHHLSNNERRKETLLELKRVLKPDGKILLSIWSIKQPEKTRRKFKYGDVIVPWNSNGIIYDRYYYIFKLDEIKNLFNECGLKISNHKWDCGNEIFMLIK